MGLLKQIDKWSSAHYPKWLSFFRVGLGLALLIRGVAFLDKMEDFEKLIANCKIHITDPWLAHTIPWFHIVGGFLIVIGLFTRAACLLQIPILIGAILFINVEKGIFAAETDLSFSVIILLLLFVFVVEGGGPLSIASYFKNN